jgi:hypothetical protein
VLKKKHKDLSSIPRINKTKQKSKRSKTPDGSRTALPFWGQLSTTTTHCTGALTCQFILGTSFGYADRHVAETSESRCPILCYCSREMGREKQTLVKSDFYKRNQPCDGMLGSPQKNQVHSSERRPLSQSFEKL